MNKVVKYDIPLADGSVMSTARTPGPWIAPGWPAETALCVDDDAVNARIGLLPEGVAIATCHGDNAGANAAHIVRCINSHAALVDALRGGLVWMENATAATMEDGNASVAETFRAALALVDGASAV